MKPYCPKKRYPVNLDLIASDVASRGIDIAPTRLAWELLARCCATADGEQGRDAFHLMAAVWPDYSRHDSELCYSRAVRQTGKALSLGYLARVLRPHGIDINNPRYRKAGKPQTIKNQKQQAKTMKNIELNTMIATLPNGRSLLGSNPLIDLLLRLYPQTTVLKAVINYFIGFQAYKTGKRGDALIFWQINEKKQILNAKRIYYKADGHRDKKMPPMVEYPGNPQCLFGLHNLNGADPDKPIAIVESEKSALIMSMVKPEYLWMACGSLNNFNEKFLQPLRHRTIVGFPDVDIKRDRASGFSVSSAMWEKTASRLREQGWNITIDKSLENNASTSQRMGKNDIADLALEHAMKQHVKRLTRKK